MKISIDELQDYLSDRYCGWATEQGMFMKLVEEIGEVAEVLNKRAGRKASDENDLQEQCSVSYPQVQYLIAPVNRFRQKLCGRLACSIPQQPPRSPLPIS